MHTHTDNDRGRTMEADGGHKLYLRYSSPQSKANIFSVQWKEKKKKKKVEGGRGKKRMSVSE